MKFTPVSSSNIAGIGYDPENRLMHVRFQDGRTAIHDAVSPAEHLELLHASSVGGAYRAKFYSKHTRFS